jgi:hypothetical protein
VSLEEELARSEQNILGIVFVVTYYCKAPNKMTSTCLSVWK